MRRTAVLTATVAMALMGLLASATPATAQAPPGSTPSDTPVSAPLTALAPPDVSLQNIKGHLDQLQSIANSNGGTRRSTTAGYTASVSYVEQKLQAAGYTTRRVNCTPGCTSGAGPDLIADWPGGDENQVIMAGAHLDSVSAGPGINDNGSGSSMVLEVALTLAAQRPTMTKHVRFGWWSDEEQGLLGSRAYVNSLSSTDRSKIKQYLNFDMVASPNGGYFINNITTAAAADLRAFYTNLGLQPEENTEGANRSDDASFRNAGIATSGVAAGASATKTSAQATKWGGTAGRAYDSCYHRACDTTTNINDTFLDRSGDALAYAIWTQAVGTPTGRDFSINATPASGSVQAGQTATTTINTTTTSGTAQTVGLTTASGLPSGATASFNPASVTSGGSSTLTLSTSASTPAGTYTVTVTGTGETATHTATYTLTVTGTSGGRTFTNGTDYAINDLSTINSPVTSTATGTAVSPVQLSITINHTCAYDLRIRLYGPSGNYYTVKAAGGTCNSFGTRTYSVPVTEQAAGTWTLQVSDLYSVDTGNLDTWTITV